MYYEKEHAHFPLKKSLWLRSKEEGNVLPSEEIDSSFLPCSCVKKSYFSSAVVRLREMNSSCI